MEKIRCPHCGKRLFDIEEHDSATIIVKCPRCKTITTVVRKSNSQ